MKRFICGILLAAFMIPLIHLNGNAAWGTENIIYLDDGSYITIEIDQQEARAAGTKTGSKTYTYTAKNGDVEWTAVQRGTFSYTGSSSTCISSSCDVSINNTAWYIYSKTSEKDGNSAITELTMGRKLLGVTVDKYSISLKLSCDANGNLS